MHRRGILSRLPILFLLLFIASSCSGPSTGAPSPHAAASPTADPTTPSIPTAFVKPSPTQTHTVESPTPATGIACADGVTLVQYSDALNKTTYDGSKVGGLSGLARAGDGNTYYALSDRDGRIYTLDFPVPGDPTITGTFQLRNESGAPYGSNDIDSEGIAVLPNGDLLVSSEVEPSIRRYTTDGRWLADLPVPAKFLVQPAGRAEQNGTFESLATSPSGQYLFTAVEEPLEGDDRTANGNGRVRILRYDLVDGAYQPAAEFLYLSNPDQGVSEIVAVSDNTLLVLERGLSLIAGFTVRIYAVSLDGAQDVSAIEHLADSDAQAVPRSLLVDITDCSSDNAAGFGGISALLDNFESMALGPTLPSGWRTLIVGSDDNFQSFEATRYLEFAIDPARLSQGAR